MKRILILLALPIVFTGCGAYYNYSGANKEKAEAEAKAWAKELGMEVVGVTCNKHDTDHDGYISCTFNMGKGNVQTFECAGNDVIQDNSGCREPKIKIPPATVRVSDD